MWPADCGASEPTPDQMAELTGWEAEVGHVLKAAVCVLDVHSVVLRRSLTCDGQWSKNHVGFETHKPNCMRRGNFELCTGQRTCINS